LNSKHLFIVCAIIAALTKTGQVRSSDYAAEADFFGESPVVLTVSRMHKPMSHSPASVSIIDREMIRNSGARELADLLRMAPGFFTGDLLGHTQVVTYQGLGHEFHRQMQVLIDGRSVFIPSYGGVPWASLPLMIEDIERIEITRGPNAVTYGSNAFLSTINIITRHAAEDAGGKVSLTQQMANRSETNDVYIRIGDQVEDLDWRLSVGRESDAGYDGRNDGKRQEKLNIRTDFLTSHNQFWSISAGINNSSRSEGDGAATDPLREARNTNSYQNLRWELIERDVQTTIKLTHTRNELDDDYLARNVVVDPSGTLPPVKSLVSFSRLSDRTDLEAYQNRRLNDQLSINYGVGLRKDEVQSLFLFADQEKYKQDTFNVFSNVEWKPLKDTILDLGFLSEDPDQGSRTESYRFAAIQGVHNHHLRFVSSSAKRHPILWEKNGQISFDVEFEQALDPPFNQFPLQQPFLLRIDWLNNARLKPESIFSNEIGLFSEFMDGQLVTDIKLFRYRISDQLEDATVALQNPILLFDALGLQPDNVLDTDARSMTNLGNTRVKGIEVSFNYDPQHNRFRLYGALSRVQARSFDQDVTDSFPDLSAYLGGHLNIASNHQISSTAYYVDSMSWLDRTEHIPDYTRVDLRYQYTIDRKKDVNIELIGYNLLDKYHDYRNRDEHKPIYLLKLSGRF